MTNDENRINWERKQKQRKRQADLVEDEILEEAFVPLQEQPPEKKATRRKRRHYVYDEEAGRVVVRRKRKRYSEWNDLDD